MVALIMVGIVCGLLGWTRGAFSASDHLYDHLKATLDGETFAKVEAAIEKAA